MVTAEGVYWIISSIIPLYAAMFIGYGSVKWWKIFDQGQCLGISRFCSLFAVPVLSFYYVSKTNLYEMNLKLFGADVLQKVIVLVVLACWYNLDPGGSIEQVITIYSICTLPNALILGIRFIMSMYHAKATPLIVEIFLAQSVIWHPLLLVMYEYRAAMMVISQQFGDTHGQDGVAGISPIDTRADDVETTGIADVGGGEMEDLHIHIHLEGHEFSRKKPSIRNEQGEIEEAVCTSTTQVIPEIEYQRASHRSILVPSTSAMTKHIMIKVWKKLTSNPNTYTTTLALLCAFALSRFYIGMPLIVSRSITFLSNASLGMGMLNMGLSMGLQPTLIPCGNMVATLTMILRFIIGPIVMAFASLVVGLRGTILRVAIVQAAISQGVAPSVFAVEYNVYPEIFNIGMTFGMIVALPVTLLYYNLLEI